MGARLSNILALAIFMLLSPASWASAEVYELPILDVSTIDGPLAVAEQILLVQTDSTDAAQIVSQLEHLPKYPYSSLRMPFQSVSWIALRLQNRLLAPKALIFEIPLPYISSVSFSVFEEGNLISEQVGGYGHPISKRPVPSRNLIYNFSVPASSEITVLINSGIYIRALLDAGRLWPESLYYATPDFIDICNWFFFGAMTLMLIYHGVIACYAPSKLLFLYIALLTSLTLLIFISQGYAFWLLGCFHLCNASR